MSTLATKNVAAVLASVALALGISFTFAAPAKADVLSDLQAQVQALLAQIASLQGGSTTGGSMSASCFTFTRNHQLGDKGGEVMEIQKFLNSHGAVVAASGAGSAGMESSYFGSLSKAAVAKFQAANGISPAAGYWGPITRAKANSMCSMTGGNTGGSTGGTGTPTGVGLTVMAGVQPANSLAPKGAQRVPFTTFTLTNNSGAPVTVTGVTVQRTGIAQDQNFSGVVLVDSNGIQIGVSHTFDSNHQTTVGDTMTLAAGASQTFTVAGNISSTNAQSGEVAAISVVGINTSAPVAGALPITGAQQTINTTLSLGNISVSTSSFDPNGATTKHIGDTGIKFSGIRFTNNSTNEDVKFYSLRWRLNGSVSASDLGNIMTVVNGTSYPTTLSADGRYYTTVFPGGILIGKGNNVEVYVQGDLVGTNASGRTVEFDIDKTSDVYFVGQVYGYGLGLTTSTFGISLPASGTHATGADTSKQPWFAGSTVTVQGGTVTTIQNATSVASQNIAVNVSNEVLGGFVTNFSGEPVTVQGMTFGIGGTGTTSTNQITLVSIVDENGSVVAGPVDASGNVLTFTNSMTFPTGAHTYTLKGKLPSSGYPNSATVVLTTNPSGWTSPQGQLTGNTVTISTAAFNMNTMTVRAASLGVSASPTPASQTVVAGGQNILFANIQLDASQSGEDVQLSSFPLVHTGTGNLAYLNNCQLWDGTTALNTGSDVVNSVSTTTTVVFTNGALRITKGTVKTLGLTCNLSSSATTATYIFGVNSGNAPTVTGVTSGNSVTPTVTTGASGTMTVSSGASVAVTIDPSSPSYAVNAAGTTGVTMGVIKLRATNENFNLTKIGLGLSATSVGKYGSASTGAGNAASGAGDLTQVYLYSSTGTLLGTAVFTGTATTATSTLNVPLALTRDTDVTIVVKADLAQIGVSASGGIGNVIAVDPINFEGTGASSGSTVRGGATAGVSGVRLMKSYPTLALDTLGSTGVADGRLMRFKVTANAAGPVSISQFKFTIATSTITGVTNVLLYGFTDSSYSQAISGQQTGGQIGSAGTPAANLATLTFAPSQASNAPVQVPAGTTYYFELRGSVAGVQTGSSVVTTLLGDAAYGTTFTSGKNVQTVAQATSSDSKNFVWSGNSIGTPVDTDTDWSDGYSLPGLPSSGLIQSRGN